MTIRAENVTLRTEIPRHERWNGPLVIPPGLKPEPGNVRCTPTRANGYCSCPRTWATACPCMYYKRTTVFIDVLQSEFALKKFDRRYVAYGMSQRDDLVMAVSALRDIDGEDKDKLQGFADTAKEHAKASRSSNIGTALHSFTEQMDLGQTLGRVPEPYPADLKAYEETTRDIEWTAIESFRVRDDLKVGGTCDRIGWYKGRLRIFDLKTSPKENPISYPHGPAMQLGMYRNSVPYDIATDTRVSDPAEIDPNVGYIIMLPAGKGRCDIVPIDIRKGWNACRLAVDVWAWRDTKNLILDPDEIIHTSTFMDMAMRATTEAELRALWVNARESCCLTEDLKQAILDRVEKVRSA